MEIKNLKKAADRILKAINPPAGGKERIIIYGDADLDGVSSVIILEETIENLGGEISAVCFPDREKEGYGINEKALNYLKSYAPALFIAVDCGIGNFKEIKLAKKLGFEVIIIDHHEILEKLPRASIIVDPKQKEDKCPFKEFAAAGIIFKLSQILLGKKMTDSLEESFLELVALATIADMMPQINENKDFIDKGLKTLDKSWRPGLRAFFEMGSFQNYGDFQQQVSKMISILNVRDVQNRLPASFRLLTVSSTEEAKAIIETLLVKNLQRRQKIREMTEEVKEKISKNIQEPIIFEGDPSWDLTLLSPVASITCHQYKKPTFLYKKDKTESQGAVRMPLGLDGVKAMMSCKSLLETYGGHPLAAGFRIKNKNLEKFKKCLMDYFSKL